MVIHNMLEEQVSERVQLMYKQVKQANPSWFTCECELCRMDTVCYVLNRMPPRYVLSGRGVAFHVSKDMSQLNADIDALVMEGIRLVSRAKRPWHDNFIKEEPDPVRPVYAFSSFIGTVYDGSTFEPLPGVEVALSQQGQLVPMTDATWGNPCRTVDSTGGAYAFHVKPIEASAGGESAVFSFTLTFSAEGYESVSYSFDVSVISGCKAHTGPYAPYSVKIQDMYLFPLEA